MLVLLAWGSMFTGIAGGVLMVCSAWSATSEDDDEYDAPMYQPGKNDYTGGNLTGGANNYVWFVFLPKNFCLKRWSSPQYQTHFPSKYKNSVYDRVLLPTKTVPFTILIF